MRRVLARSHGMGTVAGWLLALFCACFCGNAFGSVAVLLEEPYGGIMSRINPTGHTALYFDHICAASLTELRACRVGEQGVVISRYDDIANLDWVAMPLLPYLYAVDSSTEIPETMDRATLTKLRDSYRREHLESLVPDAPGGGTPDGNWYELAGSAYDRTIFGFQVKTTPEQDAAMIALLNDRRNVERYNGAFRNCADFVRVTIDRMYPHAIRRNFIADFGLTTPKSVARSLAHYGKKHPEAELQVFQIPQVPGSLPRSRKPVGVTEGLLKVYGVPLILLSPPAAGVILIAHVAQGRFHLPHNAPVLDLRQPDPVLANAVKSMGDAAAPRAPEARVVLTSDPVGNAPTPGEAVVPSESATSSTTNTTNASSDAPPPTAPAVIAVPVDSPH